MPTVQAALSGPALSVLALLCSLIILILIVVPLVLCSRCGRQSFNLKESNAQKSPSALIHVVRLEETSERRGDPNIDWLTVNEIVVRPGDGGDGLYKAHANHCDGDTNVHKENVSAQTPPMDQAPKHQEAPVVVGMPLNKVASVGQSEDATNLSPTHFITQIPKIMDGQKTVRNPLSSTEKSHCTGHPLSSDLLDPPNFQEGEESQDRRMSCVYAHVGRKIRGTEVSPHGLPSRQLSEEDGEEEEAAPPIPDRNIHLLDIA